MSPDPAAAPTIAQQVIEVCKALGIMGLGGAVWEYIKRRLEARDKVRAEREAAAGVEAAADVARAKVELEIDRRESERRERDRRLPAVADPGSVFIFPSAVQAVMEQQMKEMRQDIKDLQDWRTVIDERMGETAVEYATLNTTLGNIQKNQEAILLKASSRDDEIAVMGRNIAVLLDRPR